LRSKRSQYKEKKGKSKKKKSEKSRSPALDCKQAEPDSGAQAAANGRVEGKR
jgi:hypothetical protein